MKQWIEKRLAELVPDEGEVFRAARYSLLSGGKRLRPLLAVKTAEILGADPASALDPACAIEMIHTYSLIHDDLPCMDDDDLRRGKPTLHKVVGEAMALLAGDFLLTHAFEVLSRAPRLAAEQKLSLIDILAQRAGGRGMIGGQAIDISSVDKAIDEKTLLAMHNGKTGALMAACFEFGAVVAGKNPGDLQTLGNELGLAFQYLNDLAGERSAAKQKPTALSLFGSGETRERIGILGKSIQERLRRWPQNGGAVARFIEENILR